VRLGTRDRGKGERRSSKKQLLPSTVITVQRQRQRQRQLGNKEASLGRHRAEPVLGIWGESQ